MRSPKHFLGGTERPFSTHNPLIFLVRPAGFEPTTPGLGILCSILLSYGRPRFF